MCTINAQVSVSGTALFILCLFPSPVDEMISGEWDLWGIVLPQLEDTVKSGHATVSTWQRTMLKTC